MGDGREEVYLVGLGGPEMPMLDRLLSEVFAPGIVSTELYNHSSIAMSPDGKYLFFLAMGRGFNAVFWVDASVIPES